MSVTSKRRSSLPTERPIAIPRTISRVSAATLRRSRSSGRRPTLAALEIDLSASTGAAHLPYLRNNLRAASMLIPHKLDSLSVALVGDAAMSKLHLQFMDIPGPTDVLTFELDHDARGRVTAGEVVLCVPEARRQARRRGTGVEQELLLYAIHGLLHLTGYDDRDDAGYRAMHREEDRILTRLGIGPVFEPKPAAAAVGRRSGPKKVGR